MFDTWLIWSPFGVYVHSQYGGFSVIFIVRQTHSVLLGMPGIEQQTNQNSRNKGTWQVVSAASQFCFVADCLKRFLIGENTLHALFANHWEIVDSKLTLKGNFGKFTEDCFFFLFTAFPFAAFVFKYLIPFVLVYVFVIHRIRFCKYIVYCLVSFVNDWSYNVREVYLLKRHTFCAPDYRLHLIEWPCRVEQMNFRELCAGNLEISEIFLSKDLSQSSQLM